MKNCLLLGLILVSFSLHAQVKGKCKQAKEFNTIQIYDGIGTTLERGEENQLCPGTDTQLDNLQVTLENGILRIRKIAGKKYEKTPRIRIVYKSISRIEAYNGVDMDTRNLIIGDSLEIILKTGAILYADCDVKYLKADITEGALLKIDGYAIVQNIQCTKKASFSGFELEGDSAEVKATSGGTIKLNVEKEISGNSSTGGYIGYKQSPKIEVKTSMGGKLVKAD